MAPGGWAAVLAAGVMACGLAGAGEHVVSIRDSRFEPAALRIKAGDTVRWVNQERRTSHSVLFKAEALESERLFPDEAWVRRFERPGAYPYTCGPHPEMLGLVEVE